MKRRSGAVARGRVVAMVGAFVAFTAVTESGAAPDDPLGSADCRRALSALNAEEQAVAEASRAGGGAVTATERRAIDSRLAPARQQAAAACLARRADPATLPADRRVRPAPVVAAPLAVGPAPLVVGPAASARPTAATPRAPTTAPAPAPPRADKPYALTSCDAGGCWANDGSRLNRVGPTLWGPRGVCTVQGTLVQCP